jgi:Gas vesicle protein K/Gas vesicle protein
MQQGLAKLTLTVMEVLRQVMERQALRRVESGTLSEEQIERMGIAFMQLRQKMSESARGFGLKPRELEASLGGLMKTGVPGLDHASLVDVLDHLFSKEVVVAGQLKISVADVDLVGLDLLAMLYPIPGGKRWLGERMEAPHG